LKKGGKVTNESATSIVAGNPPTGKMAAVQQQAD